jgi:hypothetical protein
VDQPAGGTAQEGVVMDDEQLEVLTRDVAARIIQTHWRKMRSWRAQVSAMLPDSKFIMQWHACVHLPVQ